MSLVEKVKTHLLDGQSITPLEALDLFGCFRLAALIHILRKEGMNIKTENVSKNGKRFAQYSLTEEPL